MFLSVLYLRFIELTSKEVQGNSWLGYYEQNDILIYVVLKLFFFLYIFFYTPLNMWVLYVIYNHLVHLFIHILTPNKWITNFVCCFMGHTM